MAGEAIRTLDFARHYPITVQRAERVQERLRGTLVGQVSSDYLVLAGVSETELAVGDHLIVRMVLAGKAWGFEATVRDVVKSPVQLYFIDVPENIETLNLRRNERLPVFIPADVRTRTGGVDTLLLKGTILDISAGGCRLYTKRKIDTQASLNMSFMLPGEKNLLMISGVVLDSFSQNSLFGQRVKFYMTEKNLGELGAIRQWVQQNLDFAEE